jgi:transposase InsO family protein
VKTWKKVTTWIVSILALLALIVGGTVLYLIQKSKKEERLVNSVLKSNDIQISMDGKGRWVDNVMVERLWRSVKYEWFN